MWLLNSDIYELGLPFMSGISLSAVLLLDNRTIYYFSEMVVMNNPG